MNTIKLAGVRHPLPLSHIMYVLGDGNYSDAHTDDGKRILSSMTLKTIEGQSKGLIRIHKGALVNPAFIDQAASHVLLKKRTFAFITMQDGKMLSVARRRWAMLIAWE
ncbi:MAG: LytTR family transcriptional regulator [Pedobacter sp.]|nr:MAG: LytTR family transcriptional regulator [Pedobacter sp.]